MSLFDRLLGAIRLGDDDELDDDDYDEDDELDEEDDEEEDFEEDKPNKLFSMKFRKKSRDTEYDEEDDEDSDDEEDDEEEEEDKPRRSFFPFGGRKKKASRVEEEDDEDEEEEEPPRSRRSSERKSSRTRDRRSQPRRDTSARQSQSSYTSSQSTYSSGSYSSAAYSSAGTASGRTGYRSQSDEIDWSSFVTQKPGVKPKSHKKRNTGARVRVEVIVPKSMEDTQDIAELLMSDAAVILNLEFIDVDTARRIVDFSCGACYALDGGVQQVSNYVYILTPVNVEVSGDFTSMFSNFFDFTSKRSVY